MNLVNMYKLKSYEEIINLRLITANDRDYFAVHKMGLYILLVNFLFIPMWFMYWQNALAILCMSLPLCFMGVIVYMIECNNRAEGILLKYIENMPIIFTCINEFNNPEFKVGKYILTFYKNNLKNNVLIVKYGNGEIMTYCCDEIINLKICKLLDPD